jgi:hypothetical protein
MKRAMILLAAVVGAMVLYVDLSGSKFRGRIELNRKSVRDAVASAQQPERFDVERLPRPVRRYLQYALGGNRPDHTIARIRQSGVFRVNDTDNWVPIRAEQYLSIGMPSFVWHARMQPHPYLWTESQDSLLEGRAVTEHRLYAAFLFQHVVGKASDLSALARYLTEAPWAPSVLFPSRHLSWEALDEHTARAVLKFNGYQVSATFTISDAGEIVSITTNDRFRHGKGGPEATPWSAHYRRYEQHKGIKVPMEVEAEWNLNGKSFSYAKLQVDEISFGKI